MCKPLYYEAANKNKESLTFNFWLILVNLLANTIVYNKQKQYLPEYLPKWMNCEDSESSFFRMPDFHITDLLFIILWYKD